MKTILKRAERAISRTTVAKNGKGSTIYTRNTEFPDIPREDITDNMRERAEEFEHIKNTFGIEDIQSRIDKLQESMAKTGVVHTGRRPKSVKYKNSKLKTMYLPSVYAALLKDIDIAELIDVIQKDYGHQTKPTVDSVIDAAYAIGAKVNKDTITKYAEWSNISYKYLKTIRGNQPTMSYAIKILVMYGLLIEDSYFTYNNGEDDKCRRYKFNDAVIDNINLDTNKNKRGQRNRVIARVHTISDPIKDVDGKWTSIRRDGKNNKNNKTSQTTRNRAAGIKNNTPGYTNVVLCKYTDADTEVYLMESGNGQTYQLDLSEVDVINYVNRCIYSRRLRQTGLTRRNAI